MTSLSLTQRAEWHGQFWLPTNRNHQVPGTLTFNPDKGCRLVLVESLIILPGTKLREEMDLLRTPPHMPLILGKCNDGYMSLIDCSIRRGAGRVTVTKDAEIITVHEILDGVALQSVDGQTFTRFEATFEGLSAWYGTEAVVIEHVNYLPRTIRLVDDFPDLEARWKDYIITISVRTDVQDRDQAACTETIATQQSVLSIESSSPRSFADFSEIAWILRRLISLAAARELAPLSEVLIWNAELPIEEGQQRPNNSTPMPQTASLLYRSTTVADLDPRTWEWLFNQQITFSVLVPRWFKLTEKHEVPINLLISNWSINDVMVEAGISPLSTAADALSEAIGVAKPKFAKVRMESFQKDSS